MKYLLLLGMLLILPTVFAYDFSEIMYDPLGSDSNREWVEVYGPPLNSVIFVEGGNEHELTLVQGTCQDTCVSIIADNAVRFLDEYAVSKDVLVYEASWSSLKNSGELIALKQNDSVLQEVLYPTYSRSGESLQLFQETYVSAQPTPGNYQEVEVPEFGVIGALLILLGVGYARFRNR